MVEISLTPETGTCLIRRREMTIIAVVVVMVVMVEAAVVRTRGSCDAQSAGGARGMETQYPHNWSHDDAISGCSGDRVLASSTCSCTHVDAEDALPDRLRGSGRTHT